MSRKLHIERDLEIIDSHRHEITGANFILARIRNARKNRFITAWVAPWQKSIREYKTYRDEPCAGAYFELDKNNPPPETPALRRDWQKGKVYDWEDKTTRRNDARLREKHMDKTIRDICADFNLEALPEKLRHKMATAYADYDGEKNLIRFDSQRLNFLLHELAHAIDEKINDNKWAAHGPSFMRTLLAVVEKYMRWHDIEELEQLAAEDKIMIAPAAALPHLQSPRAG